MQREECLGQIREGKRKKTAQVTVRTTAARFYNCLSETAFELVTSLKQLVLITFVLTKILIKV